MALRVIYGVFDNNNTLFPGTLLHFKMSLKAANLIQKDSGGQLNYEMLLEKSSYNLLKKGIELYFLEAQITHTLPKIYNNFHEERYFIAMGDTSDKVMAATFHLVSNSAIRSMPFLELSALSVLTENLSLLLDIANENGFTVHPKNVLIFTYSSTTILWCRSLSVRYSKRVEGRISNFF